MLTCQSTTSKADSPSYRCKELLEEVLGVLQNNFGLSRLSREDISYHNTSHAHLIRTAEGL